MDNNNFNHKNKIGKLKYNDIDDLINSIKGNTISEADTKKKINELNEIKKVQTNGKRLIESQKKLLSLFDDSLKAIFNETVNESNSNIKNKSESDNESEYKNDNESDNESDNEGKKDKYYYKIRQLNNWFETIHQTKSLEDQIKLLKERGELLGEYWYVRHYHDNKELNYKIFKAKAAYILNDLVEQLFKEVFGHIFAELVEKLINTVDQEENQIIIDDIENNRDKVSREYKFDEAVIKNSDDLIDAVKIILEINEVLTSDKVNNDW